jgi:hypothetical protein
MHLWQLRGGAREDLREETIIINTAGRVKEPKEGEPSKEIKSLNDEEIISTPD